MASPDGNIDKTPHTGQVSERRRHLLKAAAVSAPVIATLQSGAAFATASANGCVQTCETKNPAPTTITDVTDGWIRAEVILYTFRFKKPNKPYRERKRYDIKPVYTTPLAPNGFITPSAGDGPFYRANGKTWSIPGNATEISVTAAAAKFILVYYDPNDAYTDVTEIGPIIPLDDESNINGLTPLTHSCLCSVDPNNIICP